MPRLKEGGDSVKKRSNGEGSVYRLANGKWRGLVADGYDNNGKLRRVSFVAQSKADVLQKMREYTEMRLSGIEIVALRMKLRYHIH